MPEKKKQKNKQERLPVLQWYYDLEVKNQVDEAAEEDGRSRSSEMTYLLKLGLAVRKHHRANTTLPLELNT